MFIALGIWLLRAQVVWASPTFVPVTPSALQGEWKTACLASSTVSQSFVLRFSATGEVVELSTAYTNNQCQGELFKSLTKSRFNLRADHVTADVFPVEAYIEFDTPPGVVAANTPPGTCHLTNWRLAKSQSVVGTDCAPRQVSIFQVSLPGPNALRVTTCLPQQPCRTLDYQRTPAP